MLSNWLQAFYKTVIPPSSGKPSWIRSCINTVIFPCSQTYIFLFFGCYNVQMLLLTQRGFKMTISLLCSCTVGAEWTVSLFNWQKKNKKSSSQDRVKSILHLQGATILLSFCIKRRDKKRHQPLWNYKNDFTPAAGGHADHESSHSDHRFTTSWKLKMPSNYEASK